MAHPFFYIDHTVALHQEIILNEDTSRHIIQVLRMKTGERLNLTDGQGVLATCVITGDNKKKCTVEVMETIQQDAAARSITVGISLLKNQGRFEWFLEKATEIGIYEIIPLLCDRTEKQKFRSERMKGILVSAMLQSQQSRMPLLRDPVPFKKIAAQSAQQQKYIAHCADDQKVNIASIARSSYDSQIILIGPEGDFTNQEIELARENHFTPVSLGETRLRTETAAMVAAVLLKITD